MAALAVARAVGRGAVVVSGPVSRWGRRRRFWGRDSSKCDGCLCAVGLWVLWAWLMLFGSTAECLLGTGRERVVMFRVPFVACARFL